MPVVLCGFHWCWEYNIWSNTVKNQVSRLVVCGDKTQGCVKCCDSQANDIPMERVDLITFIAQMRKIGISRFQCLHWIIFKLYNRLPPQIHENKLKLLITHSICIWCKRPLLLEAFSASKPPNNPVLNSKQSRGRGAAMRDQFNNV